MSDCSTQAMKPKERRTCGTCKHVSSTLLDCFYASNDSNFYMRCTRPDVVACEHYEDDPDSLLRRYEHLAKVAREMFCEYRFVIPTLASHIGIDCVTRSFVMPDVFIKKLRELGVSVDD